MRARGRRWRCVCCWSPPSVRRRPGRCPGAWPCVAGTVPSSRRRAFASACRRARPTCTTTTPSRSAARRAAAAPSSTCRSSSSRYDYHDVDLTTASQRRLITTLCSATTYAGCVALPAFACHTPAEHQAIDISCPLDPQQQSRGSQFAAVGPCWNRQYSRRRILRFFKFQKAFFTFFN